MVRPPDSATGAVSIDVTDLHRIDPALACLADPAS